MRCSLLIRNEETVFSSSTLTPNVTGSTGIERGSQLRIYLAITIPLLLATICLLVWLERAGPRNLQYPIALNVIRNRG